MSDHNEVIDASPSSSTTKLSLLSVETQNVLVYGMKNGFLDGNLNLGFQNINDNMIPELCEWIVKLGSRVDKIELKGNIITSDGAIILFDTLRVLNLDIKLIELDHNKLDDRCLSSIGEYAKSNKNIAHIHISNTQISDKGIEIIAPYFSGNTTLKGFFVDWCKSISNKSVPLILKMIESSYVEDINVSKTSITQNRDILIALACNKIKCGSSKLELYGRSITNDNLKMVCDYLKRYGIDTLKELHLYDNLITGSGASILFDMLKECNSAVSTIYFTGNQIDDICMKSLGEYIQDNQHLVRLDFGNNRLADKGIETLSYYLIGNTKLTQLELYMNQCITDLSGPILIQIVRGTCIKQLNLWDTSVNREYREQIDKLLLAPVEQRELPIKSNSKSAAKIESST